VRIIKKLLLASILIGIIGVALNYPVSALNFGSGTYGLCLYNIGCSLTISSSSTVNSNVTPSPSGACTINNDVVSVFTDDASGYTLTVKNNSTNTALLNGGSSISSTSGTQSSPLALTANQWGYRVDGVGGFGAGPTSAQSNISLNSILFAIMPASSSSPDTIASTAVAASPAVNTSVWYGVCADTTIPSGTYTTQVTYTAVTN